MVSFMSGEVVSKRSGKIARSGAGASVYLSQEELEKLGLSVGDEVEIEVTADGKIVLKPKPSVDLVQKFLNMMVGLRLGDAIDIGGAQIIPLYRGGEIEERDYITIKEAVENSTVEIKDSGTIAQVIINNTGDKPVLVIHGTVIAGGTQPRTVVANALISPNRGVRVPTRCVHSTMGIQPKARMEPIGLVPRSIFYDIATTADNVNQSHVWNNISCLLGTIVPTHNLASTAFYDLAIDTSTTWKAASNDLTKAIKTFESVAKTALMEEKKYAKRRRKPSWYDSYKKR